MYVVVVMRRRFGWFYRRQFPELKLELSEYDESGESLETRLQKERCSLNRRRGKTPVNFAVDVVYFVVQAYKRLLSCMRSHETFRDFVQLHRLAGVFDDDLCIDPKQFQLDYREIATSWKNDLHFNVQLFAIHV